MARSPNINNRKIIDIPQSDNPTISLATENKNAGIADLLTEYEQLIQESSRFRNKTSKSLL